MSVQAVQTLCGQYAWRLDSHDIAALCVAYRRESIVCLSLVYVQEAHRTYATYGSDSTSCFAGLTSTSNSPRSLWQTRSSSSSID